MVVCVAGKNRIAVETLKMVLDKSAEVIGLGNQTDDGLDGWQPSYRKFADAVGVRMVELADLYEIDGLVLLSTEYDKIIRPARFKADARLYNMHFSILPAYKGMYTSAHPILNGEQTSGCTLHTIDPGIDTGPIIDQVVFQLSQHETAKSLYGKYIDHGIELIRANLTELLYSVPPSRPQPVGGSTYYSPASINYRSLSIDLRQTCEGVIRQIRAFNHRAFQLPLVNGFRIWSALPLDTKTHALPGTVLAKTSHYIDIATIDYDCRLLFDRFDELLAAVEVDDVETLNEILNSSPLLMEESNNRGWTPLIVAAYHNSIKCTSHLIELGVNVNKANEKGTTPLMYAKDGYLLSGDPRTMIMLAKAGASSQKLDMWGRSLFDYISAEQTSNIAHLLD